LRLECQPSRAMERHKFLLVLIRYRRDYI
jgi:hypothetical protein